MEFSQRHDDRKVASGSQRLCEPEPNVFEQMSFCLTAWSLTNFFAKDLMFPSTELKPSVRVTRKDWQCKDLKTLHTYITPKLNINKPPKFEFAFRPAPPVLSHKFQFVLKCVQNTPPSKPHYCSCGAQTGGELCHQQSAAVHVALAPWLRSSRNRAHTKVLTNGMLFALATCLLAAMRRHIT